MCSRRCLHLSVIVPPVEFHRLQGLCLLASKATPNHLPALHSEVGEASGIINTGLAFGKAQRNSVLL